MGKRGRIKKFELDAGVFRAPPFLLPPQFNNSVNFKFKALDYHVYRLIKRK